MHAKLPAKACLPGPVALPLPCRPSWRSTQIACCLWIMRRCKTFALRRRPAPGRQRGALAAAVELLAGPAATRLQR